jgi:hypothetical protein
VNSRGCEQLIQLLEHLLLVEKELEHRRVEIGLENAVAAIHGAEGADMKNLVTAAGIFTGTRARFYECATISGEEQHLLTTGNGFDVTPSGNGLKHLVTVGHDLTGHVGKSILNLFCKGTTRHLLVDVEL